MVERYKEVVPVKHHNIQLLEGHIGHYPLLEDMENVVRYICDFLKVHI